MIFFEKTCEQCGRYVHLHAEHLRLVRWCRSVLSPGWWLHGVCPQCGWLTIEHQVGSLIDLADFRAAKVACTVFSRPAELDDPDWHVLVAPLSKRDARRFAEVVAARDDASLEDELAALVEVYGS